MGVGRLLSTVYGRVLTKTLIICGGVGLFAVSMDVDHVIIEYGRATHLSVAVLSVILLINSWRIESYNRRFT